MTGLDNGLQDLTAIRTMMERASKFLSLSGLSGIAIGVIALGGVWVASEMITAQGENAHWPVTFLALAVLVCALGVALFFSARIAKRRAVPLWEPGARAVAWALAVPLTAGGAFCGILLAQGTNGLLVPAMLIFYGLALHNAGNYTVSEVRALGGTEVVLGLAATFWPSAWVLFWALGFGVAHIAYGILHYRKYKG